MQPRRWALSAMMVLATPARAQPVTVSLDAQSPCRPEAALSRELRRLGLAVVAEGHLRVRIEPHPQGFLVTVTDARKRVRLERVLRQGGCDDTALATALILSHYASSLGPPAGSTNDAPLGSPDAGWSAKPRPNEASVATSASTDVQERGPTPARATSPRSPSPSPANAGPVERPNRASGATPQLAVVDAGPSTAPQTTTPDLPRAQTFAPALQDTPKDPTRPDQNTRDERAAEETSSQQRSDATVADSSATSAVASNPNASVPWTLELTIGGGGAFPGLNAAPVSWGVSADVAAVIGRRWRVGLSPFFSFGGSASVLDEAGVNRGTITARSVAVLPHVMLCTENTAELCAGIRLGARLGLGSSSGERIFQTRLAVNASAIAGIAASGTFRVGRLVFSVRTSGLAFPVTQVFSVEGLSTALSLPQFELLLELLFGAAVR